jgi:uncharacterized protein YndB with AHSA1/START domain
MRDNGRVHGAAGQPTLHLEKVLPSAPDRVFAAFVEPELLARWWGPAGFTVPGLELDVRVGGRLRIRMQPPDAAAFHLRGEYQEVDPPHGLVFTFEWEEPDPDDRETVAALSFLDHPVGTRVVLDQGPFATEARRALHEQGWTESLERLEGLLT